MNRYVAHVISALLAVGAAVAIAGLPSRGNDDAATPAVASVATIASSTTTTSAPPAPTTTAPPAPVEPTTVAPPDTTAATTTEPEPTPTSEATVAPDEPDAPADTTAPATTTTAPPDEPLLVARGFLTVAAANASGTNGVAGATADLLTDAGYDEVAAINAAEPAERSAVYHADGLEREAGRIAVDLDRAGLELVPIEAVPPLLTSRSFDIIVFIASDLAPGFVPTTDA